MAENSISELEAFQQVHQALAGFDVEVQRRIIDSVSTLLGISESRPNNRAQENHADKSGTGEPQQPAAEKEFLEFAELYSAAGPRTNSEKALLAGYWLQVCQGSASFSSQAANSELNHLGHKVANITDAMSQLVGNKPSLALQLRKSGKSQQARKTYKLSHEGVRRVKEMISGE